MIDNGPEDAALAGDANAAPRSLFESILRLSDDGQRWLYAELVVVRAEARKRLIGAAVVAGLIAAAAAIAGAALSVALFGAILALVPLLGTGLATLAVVLAGLAVALILGLLARMRLRQLLASGKVGPK